ncbi:hypothetical protein DFH28DRAFT_1087977 [Melampsora americana]|nr:hypothetical protein DFH28DRAFT_1087977 [Melampsora americana]
MTHCLLMKQSGVLNSYKRWPMHCSGIFKVENEVVSLRGRDGQCAGYASSLDMQAGLITKVPFILVDGDIAMQNFVISQHVFVRRELLVEISCDRSMMKPFVNKFAIRGCGKVLLNGQVDVKSGQENYYVATVMHRQWDMTFTAQYIYNMAILGGNRAGLIREGNILDLEGHCVRWSDWK